ncbi:MAG: hypothetical protein PCFJNLEI_02426 [Verrucomicrobiae bacterium]|nr:hypothetical protein [Verrucomicrobiae bacterium]
MKSSGCQSHSCPTNSGRRSNRCCPTPSVRGGRGPRIAASSRGFSGCSKPARAGGICRRNIPAPVPAGGGCRSGKRAGFGSRSGVSSSPSWTPVGNWTGVRVLWTGVLLLPKKGRVRQQNQTGQGHEVDGGGRRPRRSSGKAPGLSLPGGSEIATPHVGGGACAPPWARAAQESVAAGPAAARHRVDLPASEESAAARLARRALPAAVSQTVENRADLGVAGPLPPVGSAL